MLIDCQIDFQYETTFKRTNYYEGHKMTTNPFMDYIGIKNIIKNKEIINFNNMEMKPFGTTGYDEVTSNTFERTKEVDSNVGVLEVAVELFGEIRYLNEAEKSIFNNALEKVILEGTPLNIGFFDYYD